MGLVTQRRYRCSPTVSRHPFFARIGTGIFSESPFLPSMILNVSNRIRRIFPVLVVLSLLGATFPAWGQETGSSQEVEVNSLTAGQLPDSSATASYRFTVPSSGYLEVFLDSDADLTLTQPTAQGFEETAIGGVVPQVAVDEYRVEVSGPGLSEAADFQLGVYFSEEAVSDEDLLPPDKDLFVDSAGQVSLVQASKGNYLLLGSEAVTPLLYQGSPVTGFSGWEILGAEPDGNGGYEVLWRNSASGAFSLWQVDSAGNYVTGISPTETQIHERELSLGSDLDGDSRIGFPVPEGRPTAPPPEGPPEKF